MADESSTSGAVNDCSSHAGNTSGKTIGELAESFQKDLNQGQWGSDFLIGDDSLLESESGGNERAIQQSC
jgi:hypothetical protein